MNSKSIIEQATDFVCKFEGFSSTPYICPGGYKTIGYGEKMEANDTRAFIAETLAREFVVKRCKEIWKKLKRAVPPLSDNQYVALISFIYNLGWTNFMTSTLRKEILNWYNPATINVYIENREELTKKEITEQWMRWVYAKGKVLKGLETRRAKEALLFFTP